MGHILRAYPNIFRVGMVRVMYALTLKEILCDEMTMVHYHKREISNADISFATKMNNVLFFHFLVMKLRFHGF